MKIDRLPSRSRAVTRPARAEGLQDQPPIAGGRYWMGMGDVKLWLALLWAVPNEYGSSTLMAGGLAWILSGATQLLWRRVQKRKVFGVAAPGAWTAAPALAILLVIHRASSLIH